MELKSKLTETIRRAVLDAGFSDAENLAIELTEPKQKAHGDLATNIAMALASRMKANPRQIAEKLAAAIRSDDIDGVSVAGPGFINFTLSPGYYRRALAGILSYGKKYGTWNWGQGKKTQVEFVSANPTGPLTIGHGRQAVIGDVLSRLLGAVGFDVTREYYFNDAGRQMRVLGNSVRLRYLELLGEKADFPDDHYQGEYIRDIARTALKEKGESLKEKDDPAYFQKLAETVLFEDIQKTLDRLGIRFDVFYNEKSLYDSGKIDSVLKRLKEKGYSYEQDGAVWFKTTAFGQDQDRVIVKSTGEPTYRLPDIAYHIDKMDRGFDLVVDIFGADHVATYPDVLTGLQALGYDNSKVKVLIHQFVTLVEGDEKVKMSTRKANFITLDELMDDVGPDVTRYFYINRSMSSHLNFDLALARNQSEENPVYYVQYAHARICSILRKAAEEGIDPEGKADLDHLKTPEEIGLIKVLLEYPDVVSRCSREFEPHQIPAYLENLATAYHRFQHVGKVDGALRVLTSDRELTLARLALCRAARIVLSNGLELLGISAPEKM